MKPPKRPKLPRRGASKPGLSPPWTHRLALLAVELLALGVPGVLLVLAVLGRTATRFAGGDPPRSLLPLAVIVLGIAVAIGIGTSLWWKLRSRFVRLHQFLPVSIALLLAAGAVWGSLQPGFRSDMRALQALIGGAEEAERTVIAHQVYASYRRMDPRPWAQLMERGRVFESTVQEAARGFDLDADVLMGLAATESSFNPRESRDGGKGLFQLTAPPAVALSAAREALRVSTLDPLNPRHNAFVAAATLRHYFFQMRQDLFLGLLAYNIGPKNGGLVTIMSQYGAKDFATIQPYLQNLPREYPVRVLAAGLAYRLWRTTGCLPRYEEGANARRIQEMGVPGIDR